MHLVQFYTDDNFLLDTMAQFVGSALNQGDVAVVIATREHRHKLIERLNARGVATTEVLASGTFVSVDAERILSSFMIDGMPDRDRFFDVVGGALERATQASKQEHPRLAAFGEMVALLWARGECNAAIRLEQLWNELGNQVDFSLRCAYPARLIAGSGGDALLRICAEHTHVIPSESCHDGVAFPSAEERNAA